MDSLTQVQIVDVISNNLVTVIVSMVAVGLLIFAGMKLSERWTDDTTSDAERDADKKP